MFYTNIYVFVNTGVCLRVYMSNIESVCRVEIVKLELLKFCKFVKFPIYRSLIINILQLYKTVNRF